MSFGDEKGRVIETGQNPTISLVPSEQDGLGAMDVLVASHDAKGWLNPDTLRIEEELAGRPFDVFSALGQENLARALVNIGYWTAVRTGTIPTEQQVDAATGLVIDRTVRLMAVDVALGKKSVSCKFSTSLLQAIRDGFADPVRHQRTEPVGRVVGPSDGARVHLVPAGGTRGSVDVVITNVLGNPGWLDPESRLIIGEQPGRPFDIANLGVRRDLAAALVNVGSELASAHGTAYSGAQLEAGVAAVEKGVRALGWSIMKGEPDSTAGFVDTVVAPMQSAARETVHATPHAASL